MPTSGQISRRLPTLVVNDKRTLSFITGFWESPLGPLSVWSETRTEVGNPSVRVARYPLGTRERMPELQGEKPTYCVSDRFIFFINAGQFADWRSFLSNGQKNIFKLIG